LQKQDYRKQRNLNIGKSKFEKQGYYIQFALMQKASIHIAILLTALQFLMVAFPGNYTGGLAHDKIETIEDREIASQLAISESPGLPWQRALQPESNFVNSLTSTAGFTRVNYQGATASEQAISSLSQSCEASYISYFNTVIIQPQVFDLLFPFHYYT